MKQIKLLIASLVVAVFGALTLAPVATVGALDPLGNICADNRESEICQSENDDSATLIKTLVNTLLFIVGTLSVIMIIIGGIMYTISGGDAGKVTKAKNTLTYAIVGLLIAFLAYAIIFWVFRLF